jgi:hypothetical protein
MEKYLRFRGLSWGVIIIVPLLLQSCAEGGGAVENKLIPSDSVAVVQSGLMRYNGQIISIPSPVHIVNLFKEQSIVFKQDITNPVASIHRYNLEAEKAVNLGVLGADMAYVSHFNDAQLSSTYFAGLYTLAKELDLDSHIDNEIVEAVKQNFGSRDSLLSLNGRFFQACDFYLRNNGRRDVSSLILLGAWVESMHLACQYADQFPLIMQRVGEQRYSAASIGSLCNSLDSSMVLNWKSNLLELCEDLHSLESEYTYKPPVEDQQNKITYIKSSTAVSIDAERLSGIKSRIDAIRKSMIE